MTVISFPGGGPADSYDWTNWPNTGVQTLGGGAGGGGAGGGPGWMNWLRSYLPGMGALGPAAVPAIAAGGAIAGAPATQKWNETTDDPFLRDPNNAGGIPGWFGPGMSLASPAAAAPAPFVPPMHPSTMRYPMWPTPPVPQQNGPAATTTAPPAPPPPRGVKRTDAAYGPYDAPQGQPSATPRPAPNLGYYRGTSGNARTPQWQAYADPNDPRIYRGPLSGRG